MPENLSQSADDVVLYSVDEGVARITLNRPQYGNAQNFQMLDTLDAYLRRAASDDAVGAIVIGGAGKHFSSGHDLGTPGRDKHLSRPRHSLWYDHVDREGAEFQYVLEQDAYLGYCRRWQELPKPMIAMVQGACIAGGLMIAWVCDVIIAADNAYFQDPVLQMGIPGVEYFAHGFELPPRIAREFLLFGEKMTAERACQYGMVNRVVPLADLEAEAMRLARKVAGRPRFGVALVKQAFNLVEDLGGKRTAMDGVFGMHHLAHAHNQLISGDGVGKVDVRDIASGNKAVEKG